jgi:hypothetical protein
MAWEGKITEALAICRAVHERYHPSRRNPWNEIECGDHYARAMASWGVLVSLSGFEYDGPGATIGFAPRLAPDDFRCAFTAAEGWGSFIQKDDGASRHAEILVKWGTLRLKEIRLALPPGSQLGSAVVSMGNVQLASTAQQSGATVRLALDQPATLTAHRNGVVSILLTFA